MDYFLYNRGQKAKSPKGEERWDLMRTFLKLVLIFLFVLWVMSLIGCEHERTSDSYTTTTYYGNGSYPRYVSVDVYAYTSWPIDIYLGDAYVGRLNPGGRADFSKELYGGEKLRIRVVIYRPDGAYEKSMSFDDDYSNYHVNVYDGWIEKY